MKKTHRVFISATGQNDGKTLVSLGLIHAFRKKHMKVGFIKPVGQRYVLENNQKIDEDSVLIDKIYGIGCPIKDTSPIAIERGFTKKYILKSSKNMLVNKIKKSFKIVSKDKDVVIIVGTGHAGVGSVFDLSNADVASILSSKVVIVSSGGIGKPIDEIMLNKALYEKRKVKVIGVIVNKVKPHKYNKVNRMVRLGLKKKGLSVLGVIPYIHLLSEPTIGQLLEELDFERLSCEKQCLERYIGKVLVGAMTPQDALKYLSDKCLVITPGDRDDLILAVARYQMDEAKDGFSISGIVLTGGMRPHKATVDLVKKARIPLLLAENDTYSVASSVHDLTVKIKPQDLEKTRLVKDIFEKYVDIDLLSRQF